jgi:hypothetical protein
MADLSLAAQSVLDAYRSTHLSINNLVAALRAAADQVDWSWEPAEQLLAIADELDNTSQPSK